MTRLTPEQEREIAERCEKATPAAIEMLAADVKARAEKCANAALLGSLAEVQKLRVLETAARDAHATAKAYFICTADLTALLSELSALREERDAAVKAEREACAVVADAIQEGERALADLSRGTVDGQIHAFAYGVAQDIAAAIRARSAKSEADKRDVSEDADRLRDEALKRMLQTPPKKQKEVKLRAQDTRYRPASIKS